MNTDAMVLRAMLRLARRRDAADEVAIGLRVPGSEWEVRQCLRRLARCGLVEWTRAGAPRLSMAGLAVAVATLPPPSQRNRRPSRARRAA